MDQIRRGLSIARTAGALQQVHAGMNNLSGAQVERRIGRLEVITGERQPKDEATRRYRSERWTGRFVRSFTLQPNVRGDDVRADYHDGVLTVHVPKPE
jgi:hypothetical protein